MKRTILTQQGFSQHSWELPEDDARAICDILDRNNIWWAETTAGIPRGKQWKCERDIKASQSIRQLFPKWKQFKQRGAGK